MTNAATRLLGNLRVEVAVGPLHKLESCGQMTLLASGPALRQRQAFDLHILHLAC